MWPVFIKLQPRYISGPADHTQGSHEPPGVLEILSKLSLNKGQAALDPFLSLPTASSLTLAFHISLRRPMERQCQGMGISHSFVESGSADLTGILAS